MALIDEARAQAIYEAMGPAVESSGGSAANTIVGVASFGARAAFVGKVKDDELGTYSPTTSAPPVLPSTPAAASDGPSTARCYIMVTPDGERTMNTYLGAAQDLKPADIDERQVGERRQSPILRAICGIRRRPRKPSSRRREGAHEAGRRVALTLSDAFCVDRYRDEFLDLIRNGTVDMVFANERELQASMRPPISTVR